MTSAEEWAEVRRGPHTNRQFPRNFPSESELQVCPPRSGLQGFEAAFACFRPAGTLTTTTPSQALWAATDTRQLLSTHSDIIKDSHGRFHGDWPSWHRVQASVPRFWGCEFWTGAHYLLPHRILLLYSEPLTLRCDRMRIAALK